VTTLCGGFAVVSADTFAEGIDKPCELLRAQYAAAGAGCKLSVVQGFLDLYQNQEPPLRKE
jgi:hypothetical protein